MSGLRAVLFDLGNVLVRIHPEDFGHTLGLTPKAVDAYRPDIVSLTQRYERGDFSTDEFFGALQTLLHHVTREQLEEAMKRVIGKPIAGMVELLERTAMEGMVALVSNTNDFHFRYCSGRFPFLGLIPRRYLSYTLRCLKPDPAYYENVLRDLRLPASEILFVDDLRENVDGARRAGMKAHHFTETRALSEELGKYLEN